MQQPPHLQCGWLRTSSACARFLKYSATTSLKPTRSIQCSYTINTKANTIRLFYFPVPTHKSVVTAFILAMVLMAALYAKHPFHPAWFMAPVLVLAAMIAYGA